MMFSSQYLLKTYTLKLIFSLFIIIVFGNCFQIGNRNASSIPSSVHTKISYYPNGQKEYTAEYLNGKLDGLSRHWSEEGILLSESGYSYGKPHGIWKKYFVNQEIMYEVHYFHGQKHGKEKWYYENGQIKSEQTFNYGDSEYPILRWKSDGTIIY